MVDLQFDLNRGRTCLQFESLDRALQRSSNYTQERLNTDRQYGTALDPSVLGETPEIYEGALSLTLLPKIRAERERALEMLKQPNTLHLCDRPHHKFRLRILTRGNRYWVTFQSPQGHGLNRSQSSVVRQLECEDTASPESKSLYEVLPVLPLHNPIFTKW